MAEWLPSKRQIISDLVAGILVVILVGLFLWLWRMASEPDVSSLPWNAFHSPWQIATIILSGSIVAVGLGSIQVILRTAAPSSPAGGSAQAATIDEVPELSIDHVDFDGFVYVRVTNPGDPDTFVAQVIDFYAVEEQQTQYSAKWRDSDSHEMKIYKDDLITLARVIEPADVWGEEAEVDAAQSFLALGAARRRKHEGFERGKFHLFSTSRPDGWTVHCLGSAFGLPPIMGTAGRLRLAATIPPEERPLLRFEDSIALKLRVVGSRGQTTVTWVKMGFQRPERDYDSGGWIHAPPTATLSASPYA